MSEADRLKARIESYRKAEAIALGLMATSERWGLPTTVASMQARAKAARREARKAEHALAKVEAR